MHRYRISFNLSRQRRRRRWWWWWWRRDEVLFSRIFLVSVVFITSDRSFPPWYRLYHRGLWWAREHCYWWWSVSCRRPRFGRVTNSSRSSPRLSRHIPVWNRLERFAFDFRELIWQSYGIYVYRIHLETQCLREERFSSNSRKVTLTSQGHIIQIDENFMIIVENLIVLVVMDRTFNTFDHCFELKTSTND